MKLRSTLLFLAIVCHCHGDTLRLSIVAEAAGDDAERFTYQVKDKEEAIFVKKEIIISDADVQSAQPDTSPGQLFVKLNPEGAKKMVKATSDLIPRRDRIAIIVNGRVVSAPVLNMVPLGAHFMISGLTELDQRGMEEFARKLSNGRVLPAESRPIPKLPKTVPYTEEEYRMIKAVREKQGFFYVDTIPSEEELGKILHKGMTKDEVIKVLGHATHGSRSTLRLGEDDFTWRYSIAPEKRPAPPVKVAVADCFEVKFRSGKVADWKHSGFSTMSREEKLVNKSPTTLKIRPPKVDLVNEEFDPKQMIEKTKILASQAKPTRQDLYNVIRIASLPMIPVAGEEDKRLDANCDVLKFLALQLPEVAKLKQESGDGKISATALSQALALYQDGSKALPSSEAVGDAEEGTPPGAN